MIGPHARHITDDDCTSAPQSAATAAMMSLPWADLKPVDLHTFSYAIRLVRSTINAASPLTDALDAAHQALDRAADRWYAQLDRHPDAAAMEARGAGDELRDVLQLSRCTCQDSDLDSRVLQTVLFDASNALGEYLETHAGPPVPWEVGPGPAAAEQLARAKAALVTAAVVMRD